MSIKFLVLEGVGILDLGGGKCQFYFYGREDFSEFSSKIGTRDLKLPCFEIL